MILLEVGQIWNAFLWFNDADETQKKPTGKERPVVVMGWTKHGSTEDQRILIVPVTTFGDKPPARDLEGYLKVDVIGETGLDPTKQSYILARRFHTIEHKHLRGNYPKGRIDSKDLSAIRRELRLMISPAPSTLYFP
jgi:mRNA-degrading endonuclease toxin of MazEF toxin-antitoxin module